MNEWGQVSHFNISGSKSLSARPQLRFAPAPAGVALLLAVPPFLDVEGLTRHHEVGAEVRVEVGGKSVRQFLAEVEDDATDLHPARRGHRHPADPRIGIMFTDKNLGIGGRHG